MKSFFKGLMLVSVGFCIGCITTKKYMDRYNEYEENEEDKEDDISEEDKETYDTMTRQYDTASNNYDAKGEKRSKPTYWKPYAEDVTVDHSEEVENVNDAMSDAEPIEMIDKPSTPYFINSDQMGENDGWEMEDYTIFKDGYITDSYGMPVEEGETTSLFGDDFVEKFDKMQVDEVIIRNEKLRLDISVTRDLDNFKDVAPARIKRMLGISG